MILIRGRFRPCSIRRIKSSSAFTIVELLVVIVVIGILASITIVSYSGISNKAITASLTSDLSNASKQMKLYYVDHGNFPTSFNTNNCPLDSTSTIDTRYCIKFSSDTTYQYIPNNSINPPDFSIAATKGTTSYKVTNDSTPSQGDNTNFGLVLSLDAGNSASYSGSGTTWTDLSGSNNNGTLVNGVAYSSANGGVLGFDGVDDYVSVASGTNLIQNSKSFSIGLLFKMNSLASLRGLMGTLNYNCMKNLGLVANSGDLSMYNDTTTCYDIYLSGWVEINKWLFAVATYDGSSTKLYGIKDGVLSSSSGSSKSGSTNTFSSDFRIMGNQASANFTNGICPYSFVFNRVLSEPEITQRYNSIKSRYGL